MIRFKTFISEAKYMRLMDIPTKDVKSDYLYKYQQLPTIKFSREFFQRVSERGLSEPDFRFIFSQILKKEFYMWDHCKSPEQPYMFVSKSRKYAIIIRYIRDEKRFVVWTVLPKGREGTDDYPSTQKIYLENLENPDILVVEIK